MNKTDNTPENEGKPVELVPSITSLSQSLKEGDLCPKCGKGTISYDGLLNLTCPVCGFSGERGVFTC